MREMFAAACEAAGLPYADSHSFRTPLVAPLADKLQRPPEALRA